MDTKNKTTKEDIVEIIHKKSNDVAEHFDSFFSKEVELLAEDIAISFNSLHEIIDREEENQVSDADHQSALLFWTALNSLIASIELLRRGYFKEPATLSRHILEIIGTAYDIHLHPEKLSLFRSGKYRSTKGVGVVKGLSPAIGSMYGHLSEMFGHVNRLHLLPQGSYEPKRAALWIGGGFSEKNTMGCVLILSILTTTLDVANAVMEFIFYEEIKEHRFWTKLKDNEYRHFPIARIRERALALAEKLEKGLLRYPHSES